ncbi:bacterial group 2 Ig-like protein [Firmicutes bacterium CAG:582]|nr:bacterial group 2 Ig-like protein [Firmicutes bacterium CAG:582]
MKKASLFISIIIFIISCFIAYDVINRKEEIHFIPTITEIDDGVKSIKFKVDTFYLAIGESEKLNYDIESSKDDYKLTWSSENEDIVSISDGKIVGVNLGTSVVTLKSESGKKAEVSVTVTDLIRKPELDDKKKFLPCHAYTEEEAHIIDEALRTRVLNKGEGTRAALIETIRFMTLSFKYKVSYFYENGRMHESGVRKADGEGRYYHKGLYLSEDKFKDIKVSHKGPAIWGCPLTNLQDHNRYKPGAKMPNGLDCSGFVTWSLYNSGLDVGDIGAGINDRHKDMSDVGEMHSLTYEYANSGDYKVGDVIARWGHTALIAGKDSEYLYIAESLLKGVRIEKVSYKNPNSSLYKYYAYINKMDKEYSKNDDYTDMWE